MLDKVTINTNECIEDIIEYLNNQPYLRDDSKVTIKNCGEVCSYIRIGDSWEKL